MTKFRQDNTEGYSSGDLTALNEAFNQVMANNGWPNTDHDPEDSFDDFVAEVLLARYDAGDRGQTLTRKVGM